MQPLPLASRYVGAAKDDTVHPASEALGSSWIRRFLPATGGPSGAEFGKEASRLPTSVAGGGQGVQAAAGGGGRGGGDSGAQTAGPLLLAAAPNEQNKEEQLQQQQQQRDGRDVVLAKAWMGLDISEAAGKISRNDEYMQKGEVPLEREERESRQETTAGMYELAETGTKESLRKVNTPPNHAGGATYAVEGSSRPQQQEGNHRRPVFSARGDSHGNGTVGAKVRGFGPFQVFKKPQASDFGKVGGIGGPKLKAIDCEAPVEADARAAGQPDAHRISNNDNALLDRKPSGTSTMASQTGTKFSPFSKSKPLEDPWPGRSSCAVEFAGTWGFSRPKKKEDVEPDVGGSGRPFVASLGGGARETAAAVGGAGLKGRESEGRFNSFGERNPKFSLDAGRHKFRDQEGGVDRIKIASSKVNGNGVSGFPPANLGRKEDGGLATESKFLSRAVDDASPSMVNAGAGFPAGLENRKMKGMVGYGFPSGRHSETGPSQLQHSPEILSHALHPVQGDLFTGKVGHPLPFSPHSSFHGEDNSGEDTRNSRGRADRAKSPLTSLFGAPRMYEVGLDGRAVESGQHAPWKSLYAAFKGLQHDENSNSSTPTLPLDVHSRLQDGSVPVNRVFEDANANGDRGEASGAVRGRNDAQFPASPEARSRFDNQSSHFSSSPWPDEEGHIPNDDAGSGPYNSQATGSGYHSRGSRVANRGSGECKGQHMSTYRGGETEGLEKTARSRESSASEPDLRKYAGSQGEDEGQQVSNEENQAHVSSIALKHSLKQAISGHKDDTSDSSPPSYPLGYNSSDLPVLPRGIVDEHLVSIAGTFKKVNFDSEMDGSRVPRMHKGHRRDEGGFVPRKASENANSLKYDNEAAYREQKEVRSFLSKDRDLHRAQPPVRDGNREFDRQGRSDEGLEPEQRHGKLRTSGEAMGEGGISGPSKRTRHQFNPGAKDLRSQMAVPRGPSSWLTRWMPSSTDNAASSPAGFAEPKDDPGNDSTFEPPRSNGNTDFIAFSGDRRAQARIGAEAKGKEIQERSETKARIGLKELSAKRGLLGRPPHPVPSAAAIALVGTAARKLGPFPQQRRGSVAMWPPVQLYTAQAPEGGQRSS